MTHIFYEFNYSPAVYSQHRGGDVHIFKDMAGRVHFELIKNRRVLVSDYCYSYAAAVCNADLYCQHYFGKAYDFDKVCAALLS